MKKLILTASVFLLAACAQMSSGVAENASVPSKVKTCLVSEAGTRYQAGTLFTNSVKETASDITKTCLKKLALESAGISSETQSTAETIISNLKTFGSAQ